MQLYQSELESPLGLMFVVTDGERLRAVHYATHEARLQQLLTQQYGSTARHASSSANEFVHRLCDYFAGDINAVNDLPVATNGTSFQQEVWRALREIPPGTTTTYGDLAAKIGRPKACRAVGLANGSNPINIIVPCHRVIGANHSLTGYGGGIERKQWLLQHEGCVPTPFFNAQPSTAPAASDRRTAALIY